jgi:murein DD-endopeptidase MepM/ murein hydrolase activator NlpD
MKTFSNSPQYFEDALAGYLSGERSEAAWEKLEPALLDPASTLTADQKALLKELRRDEFRLHADSRLLEEYKADTPDPATLRVMVQGWSKTRAHRRVSSLARWGLSLGAGLACLFLVFSLLFSLDGAPPTTPANSPVQAEVGPATVAVQVSASPLALLYPVKGINVLVEKFGDYFGGKIHDGLDIAAVAGTPVVAAQDGVVVNAEWHSDGSGNEIILRHQGNFYTLYSHLAKIEVAPGQSVKKGEEIGVMGTTGDAVGIHLHFELLVGGPDGAKVDPLLFITSYLPNSLYKEMEK